MLVLWFTLLPFSSLTDDELISIFNPDITNSNVDLDLKKIPTDSLSDEVVDSLEFKYYTPLQLNQLASKCSTSIQLSIFHTNIRSLNENYNKLIAFTQCLNFTFDVIILSEIWATNLLYFSNLFSNYSFFYQPNIF